MMERIHIGSRICCQVLEFLVDSKESTCLVRVPQSKPLWPLHQNSRTPDQKLRSLLHVVGYASYMQKRVTGW